jgi:acetolactate decarboxylase
MASTMRRLSSVLVAFVLVFLVSGCMPSTNGITQVATIDALLSGVYDGHMSLQALRRYGDFGLGTFESLDGEMILLDGTFYKVRADGVVIQPPLSEETPFASVTTFVSNHQETLTGPMDMAALEAQIDAIVPQPNRFAAFIVRGNFHTVQTRSIPAQSKPYPPLAEATKSQSIFDFSQVTGTVLGFRLPAFVDGVNVPGYHIHFLTDDHTGGGHVLAFEMTDGVLNVDTIHDWMHIYFPLESDAFGTADLAQDRSQELQDVETNPQPATSHQ